MFDVVLFNAVCVAGCATVTPLATHLLSLVLTMADIVFCAKHKGTNSRHFHRRGDPLIAMPGNHVWGANEDKRAWIAAGKPAADWPGSFFTLRITGLTVARARRFIEAHHRPATVVDQEFTAPDESDRKVLVRRKRWRLNISELPQQLKNKLQADGYASVTLAQIKPYFRHRYNNTQVS